jgi:hypothetical protein
VAHVAALPGNSYDGHILAKVVPEITWQIGVDNGYNTRDFIAELRECGATPHVAQNKSGRRSAIDGRTTRHPGYAISLRIRKRIEEVFGWSKSSARQGKTRFRGPPRLRFAFTLTVAAYNLVRLPKLLAAA